MNTRPLLTVVLPPPAPTAAPTEATAGSRMHGIEQGLLPLGHRLEGDILRRLRQADDQPGVLLRERSPWG